MRLDQAEKLSRRRSPTPSPNVVPEHLEEVRSREARADSQDGSGGQGSPYKRNQLLGSPRRRSEAPGTSGKPNARLNSNEARKRADALQARLQKRMEELKLEPQSRRCRPSFSAACSSFQPVCSPGLSRLQPRHHWRQRIHRHPPHAHEQIVMEIERDLGFEPTDREIEKLGYDIESRVPGTGKLRFIEVKGRVSGADTITVTRNEILYSLNKPEDFILAIVEFMGDEHRVHYAREPFRARARFRGDKRQLQFRRIAGASRKPLMTELKSTSAASVEKTTVRPLVRKKLIEVALPLDAINTASVRENYIYRGNPSAIHKWWAQRPLAAARAVIFAQMVDDPSSHPDIFRTEKAQEKERQRLFQYHRRPCKWENTTNEEVLASARAKKSGRAGAAACAENADHPRAKELFNRDKLPAFQDPFAGGGTLPLEAQRLGLESYASDLNPVAVLISKAMIEIPPKFEGCRQ